MPLEAFEVVAIAREKIEQMITPHDNEAVIWGVIFELLAADFIASGWVDYANELISIRVDS